MTCDKRGYGSARKAKLANRHASFRVRVYLCPLCRQYHVTNDHKKTRYNAQRRKPRYADD